ncbi:uncharacterized protein LOC126888421 [Diabrotica virgifera virgifera]|uniref:BLOC-1-related complex subunit 5 n=3 Tax=Diabrotica virgifera virgifera TaxID=50390 RepID=A0ABM5K4A6_DIAVI|nr:uncharacterized protein LOC126883480 [Diabrotica virgifera virgifera]XP_050512630.1 uncharacterized protein LOC126888421 [Diabrotica virgifera virgifera]
MFARLFQSCFPSTGEMDLDNILNFETLKCHTQCVSVGKRVLCEESEVPPSKKRRDVFSVDSSFVPPSVSGVRDSRKRAPSEESVIYVGSETLPLNQPRSEMGRLILKIKKNTAVAAQTFKVAAEVHASPSVQTSKHHSTSFEDISDSEDGTSDHPSLQTCNKPSIEGYPSIGDILNISELGSSPEEGLTQTHITQPQAEEEIPMKPMTETQVWEKELISRTEPSLTNVVTRVLQIPNRAEAYHQALCEDFKGGLVSALERHQDRIQERLNENLKESELLKKAIQNIFSYGEKISEAFHEENIRLSQDLINIKASLANAVRSDSRDLFNKNVAGDVLRCGMRDEGA